jgi:hypothetical protein
MELGTRKGVEMSAGTTSEVKELAQRESDGIEVTLLWSPADSSLTVVCADGRTGDWFALAVEPATALDVFDHPYAYAARQGVSCGERCIEALAA